MPSRQIKRIMIKICSLDLINRNFFETDILTADGKILCEQGKEIDSKTLLKLYFKEIYVETPLSEDFVMVTNDELEQEETVFKDIIQPILKDENEILAEKKEIEPKNKGKIDQKAKKEPTPRAKKKYDDDVKREFIARTKKTEERAKKEITPRAKKKYEDEVKREFPSRAKKEAEEELKKEFKPRAKQEAEEDVKKEFKPRKKEIEEEIQKEAKPKFKKKIEEESPKEEIRTKYSLKPETEGLIENDEFTFETESELEPDTDLSSLELPDDIKKLEFDEEEAQRISELSVKIGKALGLFAKKLEELKQAAYYHNIGRTKLTEEDLLSPDFKKRQALFGYNILINEKKLPVGIAEAAKFNMQKYDTTNYKLGEDLPYSHIVAIASFFDGLLLKNMSKDEALEKMLQLGGNKFNIFILHKFIRIMKEEK